MFFGGMMVWEMKSINVGEALSGNIATQVTGAVSWFAQWVS